MICLNFTLAAGTLTTVMFSIKGTRCSDRREKAILDCLWGSHFCILGMNENSNSIARCTKRQFRKEPLTNCEKNVLLSHHQWKTRFYVNLNFLSFYGEGHLWPEECVVTISITLVQFKMYSGNCVLLHLFCFPHTAL